MTRRSRSLAALVTCVLVAAILVGAWAAGCIVQWLNLATRAAQGSIWRDPIVGDQAWRFATREREDDRAAARSEA